jgi:hypothetical protein
MELSFVRVQKIHFIVIHRGTFFIPNIPMPQVGEATGSRLN